MIQTEYQTCPKCGADLHFADGHLYAVEHVKTCEIEEQIEVIREAHPDVAEEEE